MIKQTDAVRVMDKCYDKTKYYQNSSKDDKLFRTHFPTCIYLEKGKCVLNACIRREANGRTDNPARAIANV